MSAGRPALLCAVHHLRRRARLPPDDSVASIQRCWRTDSSRTSAAVSATQVSRTCRCQSGYTAVTTPSSTRSSSPAAPAAWQRPPDRARLPRRGRPGSRSFRRRGPGRGRRPGFPLPGSHRRSTGRHRSRGAFVIMPRAAGKPLLSASPLTILRGPTDPCRDPRAAALAGCRKGSRRVPRRRLRGSGYEEGPVAAAAPA